MPRTFVGISGWTYAPWRGVFYPDDLPQKRELAYASRQLNSIEINGSFYSLQTPKSYRHWYEQTPDGFVFSVKGGRYITHLRRLKDVRVPLANSLASGVLRLNEKLGPILWQFPERFAYDADRFEAFFDLLPRDTHQAARLARAHDARLKGRNWTEADANRRMRYAVEVRSPSFMTDRFIDQLRRHKIALVQADTAGKWPYAEDMTADFVYVRLHGDAEIYVSGYDEPALSWWARRIRSWQAGREPRDAKRVGPRAGKAGPRDAYVYFDNDVKVRAPFDAMALADMLAGRRPRRGEVGQVPIEITEEARRSWPTVGRGSVRGRSPRRAS